MSYNRYTNQISLLRMARMTFFTVLSNRIASGILGSWNWHVQESGGVGGPYEGEHGDHGSVAHQREEVVLRHLEQSLRRCRRAED